MDKKSLFPRFIRDVFLWGAPLRAMWRAWPLAAVMSTLVAGMFLVSLAYHHLSGGTFAISVAVTTYLVVGIWVFIIKNFPPVVGDD